MKIFLRILTALSVTICLFASSLPVKAETDTASPVRTTSLLRYFGAKSVREAKIPEGVYAGGYEMAGLTRRDAIARIQEYVASIAESVVILVDEEGNGYDLPCTSFGVRWGNPQIVKSAAELLEDGNVLSRYKKKTDLKAEPQVYDIQITFEDQALTEALNQVSRQLGDACTNATLTRVDGAFVITPGEAGYGMDVDKTAQEVRAVLTQSAPSDVYSVDIVMGIVEPQYGESELALVQDLLGSFTTSYKSSSSARCSNIANACSKVNGTVLLPGEEFSTLATITPFTIANGYKEAGSYAGGKVVQSVGGGICQVSSTLYNAVLLSELEVTDRSNHAMMVDYVKVGMDATVSNDSGVDFRFRNNTAHPIYIEGYTENKTITLNIYGVETRLPSHQVSYETEIVKKIPPDGEFCYADSSHAVGYVEVQPAHTGYEANVYKIITEDGEEVSRELMTFSKYKMTNKYALVGTATTDPTTLAVISAAIATNSISHVKSIAAQLATGTYTVPTPVPVNPIEITIPVDPSVNPVDPAALPQ